MKLIEYVERKLKYENTNRNTLLIGDGGQSKSYQLINLTKHFISSEKTVPIYIPLCETGTQKDGYSILNFIYKEYINDQREISSNYEKKLISMFKNTNQVKYIVICDGYNELLESYTNQSVSVTITREIKQLSEIENVYLIISSRYILTGTLFSDFSVVDVCDLSNQQLKHFVPDIDSKKGELVELLRSPFYLTKYLEYIKESKFSSDLSISAGELLNGYLTEYIPLKYEKEHSLDTNNPVIRKLKYCLKVFIPEIAAYMVSNHTRSISATEMGLCLNKDQSPLTIDWNIADLIGNYIVPCNLMYCSEQSESNRYFFVHEIYQDYFTALWWVNKTKRDVFTEDLLQFSLGVQVKRYIGDILNENRYKNKSDIKSETSPIERILRKNCGVFNNKKIQKFNSNCVEIMKISRNYSITADYSELDLSQCRFANSNCQNSSFQNSSVEKNTFLGDTNSFSDVDLMAIWSNGDIIVTVDHWGKITATSIVDGSLIYRNSYHESLGCSDVYIDDKKIVFINWWGDIRIFDTLNGKLIKKRKLVNLLKDEKGIFKPLIRCVAEIYRLYFYLENKGEIYVINGTFSHKDRTVYDKKNDLYLVIHKNLTEVFDTSFNRIGELEIKRYTEYKEWNICQNGWLIGSSDAADELIFQQIAKSPLRISSTKKLSIDIKRLQLVYISSKGDYAAILDKELNVTVMDLKTGSCVSNKVPYFRPSGCIFESFCLDDNYLSFFYDGFDNNKIKRQGICVYNYRNNRFRFKTITLGSYISRVHIITGSYGFVVISGETTYLLNPSLIEISVVKNYDHLCSLSAYGRLINCSSDTQTISFLCKESNNRICITTKGTANHGIKSDDDVDCFIATDNYLIHKSGARFINCALVNHFSEPSCDIVKSKISNQYAIIKYNHDSPNPNAEILIIENNRTLGTKKIILPLYNHIDNNVYNLFSKCDDGDPLTEPIEKLNPHILYDSFQFVHGNLYCFFDNLYYTSLVKIDITNALVNTVLDLKGRYAQNFVINEEYIISYCSESPFVEPYTSEEGNLVIDIPTCSIDTEIGVSLLKSGKHFNIDLSKVPGNYPEETITGGIDQYAFSSESNVLAVKQYGTNTILFYRFSNTDDNVRCEFIKKVDIIATANYQGCDFNGVSLDDKTIQCLIDNGGHI